MFFGSFPTQAGYSRLSLQRAHPAIYFVFATFTGVLAHDALSLRCTTTVVDGALVGMKWGPNCQHSCNCAGSVSCDRRTGFCANGCRQGWTRSSEVGPCEVALERTEQISSAVKMQADNDSSTIPESVDKSARGFHNQAEMSSFQMSEDGVTYSFSPTSKCRRTASRQVKTWTIRLPVPILVHNIHIGFEPAPAAFERMMVDFFLHSYPEYNFSLLLHQGASKPRGELRTQVQGRVFTDIMSASLFSFPGLRRHKLDLCKVTAVKTFKVTGVPLCAYRWWGPQCGHRCRCPCNVTACHPITGECSWDETSDRAFRPCPTRTFGPSCSEKCSEKCQGETKTCHVISGFCQTCGSLNETGRQCEVSLSSEEDEDEGGSDGFNCSALTLGWLIKPGTDLKTRDNVLKVKKDILIGVALAVFVLVLGILFWLTRVLYKLKRAKLHVHEMRQMEAARMRRESMASYTEFEHEFSEKYGSNPLARHLSLRSSLGEGTSVDSRYSFRLSVASGQSRNKRASL